VVSRHDEGGAAYAHTVRAAASNYTSHAGVCMFVCLCGRVCVFVSVSFCVPLPLFTPLPPPPLELACSRLPSPHPHTSTTAAPTCIHTHHNTNNINPPAFTRITTPTLHQIGLVAARRMRMGFLPKKSEVVHVRLKMEQALEQLRLQCVHVISFEPQHDVLSLVVTNVCVWY